MNAQRGLFRQLGRCINTFYSDMYSIGADKQ